MLVIGVPSIKFVIIFIFENEISAAYDILITGMLALEQITDLA